jgi:transposase
VRKPQVIPDEDHEVAYERVAAVDVAKASGVACMRTPDPERPGRYVNRIWDNVPATRARIAELGRELLRCQVQMVTLESTSDYWRIWYYVLESAGPSVRRAGKSSRSRSGPPSRAERTWMRASPPTCRRLN